MQVGLQVYKSLKEFIFNNQILPGERLYLESLSKKLNISVTPLREALNRLVQEGLVYHHANRAYTLRIISVSEVKELYDFCEALETYAIQQVAKDVAPADLSELQQNLMKYKKVIEGNYTRDRFLINNEFHLHIARLSRNSIIVQTLEKAFEKIMWKWKVENIMQGRGSEAFDEHKAIYTSLEKHDVAGSVTSMRNHIITTKEDVLRILGLSARESLFTDANHSSY